MLERIVSFIFKNFDPKITNSCLDRVSTLLSVPLCVLASDTLL